MRNVFQPLVGAIAALLFPCLSWAAERLPEPLVRFAFADDSLTNTGTLTLQSQPTVADGFTFTDATDANGVTRRALKSTGNAVTNVDLAAEDIKVSGSTVSFWTTTTTANWRDAVGVDFLFDPAESTRAWQVWERMGAANQMAVYGVTGPSGVSIGDTGKLHHWAMVGEGTHLSFYFDGRFLGRYDKSAQITGDSLLAAFGFGGSATRNNQGGVASTADARIYGVPLSPAKVAFLASGETLGFCEAPVEGEQAFGDLAWDEGEAYEEGTTSVMGLRLAPGATLGLDRALALDRLFLSVPEGAAAVRLSGEGSLAGVGEIVVFGNVDLGSAAIPSLTISAGATATVEARSQIAALNQVGTLRLAGGDALEGLSVDAAVTVGQTLAVAKAATTETLPISGRTLRIEPGADITVTTQLRTAHTNDGGESVVDQTGGTLTCAGPAETNYKLGAFVLSHWNHVTRYNLSGGTLNVTESSAKLGADGTGNLTVSGTGVANLHSVSLKSGTLKVEAGGTLNLGAEAVPSATGVVGFNGGALGLAGGTLGPWTRADLTIAGAVTVSADTIVRTSPAEGDTERAATVAFAGTLSGAGGLVAQGPGTLDLSAATVLCEGGLSVGAGCSARIGAWRPTLNAFGEGATLTLTPTTTEALDLRLPLADGVTLPEGSLSVSGWDDIEVTAESGAVVVRKVTSVPTWTPTDDNAAWDDLALWKHAEAIPTSGQVTLDYRALTRPKAIAIPTGTAFEATVLQGSDAAGCALTLTLGEGATLGTLTVAGNATVPLSAANANADGVLIPEGRTLTVDVAGDGTLTAALSGEGAFVKAGAGTLTLNAEVAPLGGTTVAQGCLRFGTATVGGDAYTTAGNVTVETGATLDAGGKIDAWLDTVTLKAGATYANSGTEIGTNKRQLRNIVLEGDATVRADGNFGFIASNHGATRLTLNGHTLTKTGPGTFWLCNTTTSSGTLRVEEGKFQTVNGKENPFVGPMTFSSDVDGAFDFANGTVPLSGAFTKDGAGGMTFPGVLSGDGALSVRAGALTLTAANERNANALTTIEKEATLDVSAASTRLYRMEFGGAQNSTTMTIRGRLVTRNWAYSEGEGTGNALGALRTNVYAVQLDGGTVKFVDTDGNGPGARGFTVTANGATVELPEGNSLELPVTGTAHVSLDAAGELTVRGGGTLSLLQNQALAGAVTVAEGTALSGTGTIQGTVTLEAGATLDATAGVLTVGALTVPDGEGVVTLRAAADAPKGTEVLRLSTPVDAATFNEDAFTVQGTTLGVVPSSNGSALILTFVATFPDAVGADNGELTDAAATALLAAAERLGVTEVSSLTGRTYGRDLTAAELSDALECFVGEGLVSKGEAYAEGTPLTVAYDFGISAFAHNPDGSFTVTVRVQDAAGGDTVAFAEGTKVELYAPALPDETLVEPKTVEGTPSLVTFEIPSTASSARFVVRPLPFKARVRKE